MRSGATSIPTHPRHEPGHRYRDAIRNYYAYLDEEIGELLERFDDDTAVLVVSDHGARPMQGAICVNEWLAAGGIPGARQSRPRGSRRSARRRSTGAGRGRGGRAATTAACASTFAGASRRASSRPPSTSAAATSSPRGLEALRRARRDADRHTRLPPERAVARAARHPARPDRLLRRPRLAQQRQPRPRAPLDLRQRHRARRRQPRSRRDVHRHRPRRARGPPRGSRDLRRRPDGPRARRPAGRPRHAGAAARRLSRRRDKLRTSRYWINPRLAAVTSAPICSSCLTCVRPCVTTGRGPWQGPALASACAPMCARRCAALTQPKMSPS